jgi:hypothetical protein
MKRLYSKIILLNIILFSSCRQLPANTPATSTNTLIPQFNQDKVEAVSIFTATSIPCLESPLSQTQPTTDIEKISETWFLSDISLIPNRLNYKFVDSPQDWAGICKQYQQAILTNNDWIHSPTEAALTLITKSDHLSIYPSNQIILAAENYKNINAENKNNFTENIAVVVVNYFRDGTYFETRFDFIVEDEIWRPKWWGLRWKCTNNMNSSEWNTDTINCQ